MVCTKGIFSIALYSGSQETITYLSDCNDRKKMPDESLLHLFSSFWHAIQVWWSKVFSSRTPNRMSIERTEIPSSPLSCNCFRIFGTIFSINNVLSFWVSVKVDDAKNISVNGSGSHSSKWNPSDSALKQPRMTCFRKAVICSIGNLPRRTSEWQRLTSTGNPSVLMPQLHNLEWYWSSVTLWTGWIISRL